MKINFDRIVDTLIDLAPQLLIAAVVFVLCKIVMNMLMKLLDKLLDRVDLDENIAKLARKAANIVLWVLTLIIIAAILGFNAVSPVTALSIDALVNLGMKLGKAALVFIGCKVAMNLILKLLDKLFIRIDLDEGIKSFGRSAANIGLWFLTIIFVAESLDIKTTSLVALLSVVSLALSLSLQNILTNVFSGLTILMSRPFKAGDYVELATVAGTVMRITIMRTTLLTPDNKEIQIPNSDITTSKVINYSSEPTRRVDMTFSASYDDATETVKDAIMDAIKTDSRILMDPAPFIGLSQFNENDITYVVRVWCNGPDYWNVYFNLNERVRDSFAAHGVQFSYPHTVVHIEH